MTKAEQDRRVAEEKAKILARLHQPFHLLEADAVKEDSKRLAEVAALQKMAGV